MNKKVARERHSMSVKVWGAHTLKGPWIFNEEEYQYVTQERTGGEGEWWRVIVKRKSDDKHFEFQWEYHSGYRYERGLVEVFPKTIATTIYE